MYVLRLSSVLTVWQQGCSTYMQHLIPLSNMFGNSHFSLCGRPQQQPALVLQCRDEALLEAKGGNASVATVPLAKYIKANAIQKARQEWRFFGSANDESHSTRRKGSAEGEDSKPPGKKAVVALIRASGLPSSYCFGFINTRQRCQLMSKRMMTHGIPQCSDQAFIRVWNDMTRWPHLMQAEERHQLETKQT